MNAIGTQLRDPINSVLARWPLAVSINKWTPPRKAGGIPGVSTRFSPSIEKKQTAKSVSRGQIIRREQGQGNVPFPCQANHEQDWQPYPVDPYSAKCDDHTYILVILCDSHWYY